MLTFGIVLASLIAIIAAYFVVVVFSPWIREEQQTIPVGHGSADKRAKEPALFGAVASESVERREVRFKVSGEDVVGWLYLPRIPARPVPCVIMNNGLGGTKEIALEPFALRFCQAGLSALTFDYRHFGESSGEPRQLFLTDLQIADCRAAVAYARNLPEIDSERIAIWGTSVSGGYGLLIAAEDGGIACVCSQCGSLDHGADGKLIFKREGIGYFFRLFIHAARDKGRARFGLSPHHIAIVGRPGTVALLTAPGLLEDCVPVFGPGFNNEMCARVMVTPHGKTASEVIDKVRCPVLIQICEKDTTVSLPGSLGIARRLGTLAEVKRYPIGHFDVYQGEHFKRSVADQIEFFARHLIQRPERGGAQEDI